MCDYNFYLNLKFLMSNAFWILLQSLVWNGEISRDEDMPFPFNVIAQLLKGDKDLEINLKEKESKGDGNSDLSVSNYNYYDGYISANNRISGSSLSEISLNNLYNFLTDPNIAASSLIITAGLVIQFCSLSSILN